MSTIPVLITYSEATPERREAGERRADRGDLEERLKGISASAHSYSHVPAVLAKLPLKDMEKNHDVLRGLEGCKIWLDRKVEVKLDESAPLIEASRLWENGYRGENQNVAILDTGIDDSHPDLDDLDDNEQTIDPKVIAENNFTVEENADDLLGPGSPLLSGRVGELPETNGFRTSRLPIDYPAKSTYFRSGRVTAPLTLLKLPLIYLHPFLYPHKGFCEVPQDFRPPGIELVQPLLQFVRRRIGGEWTLPSIIG